MKNIKLNNRDRFDYSKNAGNWDEDTEEMEKEEQGVNDKDLLFIVLNTLSCCRYVSWVFYY